jgi:hypothetical protein
MEQAQTLKHTPRLHVCVTLGVVSVQHQQCQPPFLLGKGALPNLDDEAELSGEPQRSACQSLRGVCVFRT